MKITKKDNTDENIRYFQEITAEDLVELDISAAGGADMTPQERCISYQDNTHICQLINIANYR